MTTKSSKFTITLIASLFALLLFVAGASAIKASAAQAELIDDRGISTDSALRFDDRQSSAVEFFGTIQAIDGSSWTISGLAVAVQPGAEIKGVFAVGDQVKVHAFRAADGSLVVREITASLGVFDDNDNANANEAIEDQSGNSNANLNGDDNGNGSDDGNANLNGDDNGNANDDNGNVNDNGNANDDDGDDDNGNVNDNGNANDDDRGG